MTWFFCTVLYNCCLLEQSIKNIISYPVRCFVNTKAFRAFYRWRTGGADFRENPGYPSRVEIQETTGTHFIYIMLGCLALGINFILDAICERFFDFPLYPHDVIIVLAALIALFEVILHRSKGYERCFKQFAKMPVHTRRRSALMTLSVALACGIFFVYSSHLSRHIRGGPSKFKYVSRYPAPRGYEGYYHWRVRRLKNVIWPGKFIRVAPQELPPNRRSSRKRSSEETVKRSHTSKP